MLPPTVTPDLPQESYLNLATFRRNGTEVRTPVWFAPDPANPRRLFVYTNGKSGKVKRLRRDARSRLAACNVRGTVRGAWVDVRTHVVDGEVAQQPAFAALRAKYGWQMRALELAAQIGGRWKDRTILAIELPS